MQILCNAQDWFFSHDSIQHSGLWFKTYHYAKLGWTNERTNEQTNELTKEWMNEWMNDWLKE
jgi:hypothetical protein